MRSKVQSLPDDERRDMAAHVALAFWDAFGLDDPHSASETQPNDLNQQTEQQQQQQSEISATQARDSQRSYCEKQVEHPLH